MSLTPSEQMANFASAIASECKAIHALINAAKEIKDSATGTGTTWSSSKISSELTAAKNEVKNDLLGGAGAAYDTLKELRDLIASNASSIEALEALAAGHVRFNAAQTLTDTEKAQARSNIGAAAQSSLSSVDSRLSIAESGLASVTTTANSTKSTVESLSTTVGTKANASEVVKLSGSQTIAGTKTFSSTIEGSISGNAATADSATKATQDASGNVITSTYLTKTDASATYLGKTAKASSATTADSATKATQDASGNVITSTYLTKTDASTTYLGKTAKASSAATADSATKAIQDGNGDIITDTYLTKADASTTYLGKTAKASSAATADSATKATQDASGNVITSTYATKASLASVATSGKYSDLSGVPTALKNPTALTLQNSAGTSIGSYDGSTATTVKLTSSTVGLGNVTNESKATMLASAALTGTPTAPTATAGTNTTQVATTAFVTTAVANKTSVSGNAGTATKLATAKTIALSGDVSGSADFDGSEGITITATVADDSHNHVIGNVDGLQTALNAKAPSASPTLTGTPKAPTATAGTNTTQIATTAFVTAAVSTAESSAKSYIDTKVANLVNSAPETLDTLGELATALSENIDVTSALNSAIGTKANSSEVVKLSGDQTIAGTKTFSSTISGSISGNAATATKATQDGSGNVITSTYLTKTSASNTYLGKTAKAASATSADSATKATQDGSGNVITSTYAPLASPTFTGTPKVPTATAGTNTTQIATTAFVMNAISGISSSLGSLPQVGDIKLFHGTLGGSDGRRPVDGVTGMVDEAWELCDGTNGTPDMRGQLAYGAGGTLDVGATYGASATSVDKAGFDYALGTRSEQTTTTVLTSPPQGVGLYYLKKTS